MTDTMLSATRPDPTMADAERRRMMLSVALQSDNPTVVAAVETLLVVTQITEARAVAIKLREAQTAKRWAVCTVNMSYLVTLVVIALQTADPDCIAALENFVDVARFR